MRNAGRLFGVLTFVEGGIGDALQEAAYWASVPTWLQSISSGAQSKWSSLKS